jgi:hypothetical protein
MNESVRLPRILASVVGSAVVLALHSPPALAGSPTGPSPVSFDSQYRLAQQARSGEQAVKDTLPTAFSVDAGATAEDWLSIADTFDTRAAMIERVPSMAKKAEYSLGVDIAELKLAGRVIREVVAATPPASDAKRKAHWIEVAYLAPEKQSAFIDAVRARLSDLMNEAVKNGTHPGSAGTSLFTDGDTVVWDLHSPDAGYTAQMVAVERAVAAEHGATW